MRELPDDVVTEISELVAGSPMEAHLDALLLAIRPAVSIRVDEAPDQDSAIAA